MKIFKNTAYLYGRQIFVILINLLTVRYLIKYFGIEMYADFGAISALVLFVNFFATALNFTTLRYATYKIVRDKTASLNQIATLSYFIYFCIVFITLIIYIIITKKYLDNLINLNTMQAQDAENLVLLSLTVFFVSLAVAPLTAILVAEQKFSIIAINGIIESILRLISVLMLNFLENITIQSYLYLSLIQASLTLGVYACTVDKKIYIVTKHHSKNLIISNINVFKYFFWSCLGIVTSSLRNHGVSLIIGKMYSPGIFVGRIIATSLSININQFINSYNQVLYPYILKKQAEQNKETFTKNIVTASKINLVLLCIFLTPIMVFSEELIKLWLNELPEQASGIIKLSLLEIMISGYGIILSTVLRINEKIQKFEMYLGFVQILNVLIVFCAARQEYDINTLLLINIVFASISYLTKLLLLKVTQVLAFREIVTKVILKQVPDLIFLIVLNIILILGETSKWTDGFKISMCTAIILSSISIVLLDSNIRQNLEKLSIRRL